MGSQNAWGAFQPYKDTLARQRENYDWSDRDDESMVSDIPELSRTQEVELRRRGNTLDTPSFDLHQDEPDSPRKRVSWPSPDELASTLRTNMGSVRDSRELIPEETREQTPRVTGYTNRVMTFQSAQPALGGARAVDFGNIQQNYGHSTRQLLQGISSVEEDDTATDQASRQQSSTRSTGGQQQQQQQQQQQHHDIRSAGRLDQTMRTELRSIETEQTHPKVLYTSATEEVQIEDRRRQDNIDESNRRVDMKAYRDKKILPCWTKCIGFAAGVAIFLAVIIALAVVVANGGESGKHGGIIPDPKEPIACENVHLRLGDTIKFTCNFSEEHAARQTSTLARDIYVIAPNKINSGLFKAARIDSYHWEVTGPSVTCNSQGQYKLVFNRTVLGEVEEVYSLFVSLHINAGDVETSIRQVETDHNNTSFEATCHVSGDCNNYDVNFIGSKNNRSISLDVNKQCSGNYSDEEGNTMRCNTTFHGADTDFSRRYPLCRVSAGFGVKIHVLELPSCRPLDGCEKDCGDIGGDDCSSNDTITCFNPALPVFDQDQSDTCGLGWCMGLSVEKSLTVTKALCMNISSVTSSTTAMRYDTANRASTIAPP